MKNFWKLGDVSLFTVPYMYIDHNSYLADPLLAEHKISMRFKGEMVKKSSPYRVIFCRVRKRDAVKFEEILEKLTNKMLLLGHTEYPQFCGEIESMIEDAMKRRKKT